MESSDPVQAARQKLIESLSSCAQQKQVVTATQASLKAMEYSHQTKSTRSQKRQKQRISVQKMALGRAHRRFQDRQRNVTARLVELSKVELRAITEELQQKLPLELRQIIFKMCWDDKSVEWAQEILRFSQILHNNGDRYQTFRQLEGTEGVFEGSPEDAFEQYLRKTPHIRQLSNEDRDVLFKIEGMDRFGLPKLDTQEPDVNSIIRCLGQYLTSPQVVGYGTAREFLLEFYRMDLQRNFYVELPHLKHFLEYDPFELDVPPSIGLTNITVPLNDFDCTTPLNIEFDQEPLLNLKKKSCFSLKFVVYALTFVYGPSDDDLEVIQSLINKLKKTLKSVSCICVPVCECCVTPLPENEAYDPI